MKRGVLIRLLSDKIRTLGRLFVFDGLLPVFIGVTLEPPWKDNEKKISCIPIGKYLVFPRSSDKFGQHYILNNVPGRDLILIHPGNAPKDTEGCILVGRDFSGPDITNSRAALNSLLKACPDGLSMEIING